MTPGARVAAAIEILDLYLSGTPAEQALTGWGRRHRFAGSKDRAAIRDHVFDALRRLKSSRALGGGDTGRAIMIGLLRGQGRDPDTLFTGEGHAPAPLTDAEGQAGRAPTRAERLDCPDWLLPQFDDSLGPQAEDVLLALRNRAPVFLRVNTARVTLDQAQEILSRDGIVTQPHAGADTALEVLENPRKINNSRAFLDGAVELQDAASQAVVAALQVTPGMRVLDYCAGGGGKALALAAMGAEVVAHDIAPARMKDLPARAARAGCRIQIATPDSLPELLAVQGPFDLAFADAPCSGSGSWRRVPQGKWLLTPDRLSALHRTQRQVLALLATLIKPGGVVAYATCSVLTSENRVQVNGFVAEHPDYECAFDRQLLPTDGGDGFYVARLGRT
ncbi:RsmB/NOP family class I SAM-dependent RNA methyltransferase [Aliiroseovarius sediminis]|uniref:RsmB/NOP family class I SAM-dependent RNA methyltransferase n=1 Tax=Aliiroseovarius sediminis TaxID=2925839 RepID=UPI001F58F699|nr:RsmB/NOP family class I SAM-dependent RNA methyltransferase [Aliiroseovarius sediminis]MCI2393173.1 RsmB/NOP family class I SAM-dependent RNA methyltransferase [Aliiroseovarius sediminis]